VSDAALTCLQVCLGPFSVFDVEVGRQEAGLRGRSYQNHEEVKFIFTILNYLFDKYRPEEIGSIGVISPYKAQVCAWICCIKACMPTMVAACQQYSAQLAGKFH
jgi:hypothetical protein